MQVLESAGAEFRQIDGEGGGKKRLSDKLTDEDICLSLLDKVNGEGGEKGGDAELGSFLSSANEPTITRQLNVLSNIVKRAFLFGGDSELRVLAETLEEEKSAFVKRWYGGSKTGVSKTDASRDGVAYLEALILLCRVAYQQGIVDSLIPYVQLNQGYGNSYERPAASLVEMGSGYVKIKQGEIKKKQLPKTPTEELARFVGWEKKIRRMSSTVVDAYPCDLVGGWQVTDEVGGQQIGISSVNLQKDGEVRGERWGYATRDGWIEAGPQQHTSHRYN